MATIWWVLGAMSPNELQPLFMPIDFEVDVEARRARLNIPGLLEATGEPMRNPVFTEEKGPEVCRGVFERCRLRIPALSR